MDQYSFKNTITVVIVLYRENYSILYKTLTKLEILKNNN